MSDVYDEGSWERFDGFDNCFSERGWTPSKPYMLNTLDLIRPKSMLDAGCCLGHYIDLLRGRGYKGHYTGADITPKLVAQATKEQPRETFIEADARDLPFKDGSFELAMSSEVLMHLPEIDNAMSELFRLAKKDVLISCYGTSGHEVIKDVDEENGFNNYQYPMKEIEDRAPAGWELRKFRVFPRRVWPFFHYWFRRRET